MFLASHILSVLRSEQSYYIHDGTRDCVIQPWPNPEGNYELVGCDDPHGYVWAIITPEGRIRVDRYFSPEGMDALTLPHPDDAVPAGWWLDN